jgi:hypothetical protein
MCNRRKRNALNLIYVHETVCVCVDGVAPENLIYVSLWGGEGVREREREREREKSKLNHDFKSCALEWRG